MSTLQTRRARFAGSFFAAVMMTSAYPALAGTVHTFTIAVDDIYIGTTRAHTDTDVITTSAIVEYSDGYKPIYGPDQYAIGDVGVGYHATRAFTNQVYVPDNATGHFGYSIANVGASGGSSGSVLSTLNGLSNDTRTVLNAVWASTAWDWLNARTHDINSYFIAVCDGYVAGGKLDFDLPTLLANAPQDGASFGNWSQSLGSSSPFVCGPDKSNYWVHWTITRKDYTNNSDMDR